MVEYLQGPYEIIERPLDWQRRGLQQTASGYGKKLTSTKCVKFGNGVERRVYITQYGNAGSAWVLIGGKKLFLRG